MKSLRRIFQFMRPYSWQLFFGFWATVLPVAMELSVPRLLQFVIDEGIRPRELDMILLGAFWMFVAAMIGALSTLGQGYCRAVVSQGLAFDIRHALFRHIQSLSFANLDQMQTGQLMTRVSSDVDVVRMFSSAGLALLLRVLLMIIGSMVMLLLTDWQLSLIMFAVAAVSGLFIRYLMLKATRLFTVVQQRLGALNTLVQENLAGIQVVKAFVRGRFEIDQFHDQQSGIPRTQYRSGPANGGCHANPAGADQRGNGGRALVRRLVCLGRSAHHRRADRLQQLSDDRHGSAAFPRQSADDVRPRRSLRRTGDGSA